MKFSDYHERKWYGVMKMDYKKGSCINEYSCYSERSGRFYTLEDNWYFLARDYQDQGPFASKEEAEVALKKFIENVERDDIKNENFNLKLV